MISNKHAREEAEEFQAEANRLDSVNLDRVQKRELEAWEIVPASSLAHTPKGLTARKRSRGFRNNAIEEAIKKVLG